MIMTKHLAIARHFIMLAAMGSAFTRFAAAFPFMTISKAKSNTTWRNSKDPEEAKLPKDFTLAVTCVSWFTRNRRLLIAC